LRLQSLVYEKGFEAAVDVDRGDGCSCHLLHRPTDGNRSCWQCTR
jgi:hypothetical protein